MNIYTDYSLEVDDIQTYIYYKTVERVIPTYQLTDFLRDNPLFHDYLRKTGLPFDNAFQFDALYGIPDSIGKLFAIQLSLNNA